MGELFYLLQQWARWCQHGTGIPGYKGAWAMLAQLSGAVLPEPSIDDDLAMAIDKAITLLVARKRACGEAVVVYFICNCQSQAALATKLGCSRSAARNLFDGGMSFLDGYFADLQEQSASSLNAA